MYDAEGCPAVDSIRLWVEPNVYVPNVFAPASVSGNAHFFLSSRYPLPIEDLSIYDRWGELVYEDKNFAVNDETRGWDGVFRGKECDPGVFVWHVEVEYLDGYREALSGNVTLIR